MRRVVGAALVAIVLVAVPATAGAQTSATPLTTANVKAAGISLKYPKTWTVVFYDQEGSQQRRRSSRKKNPKLAAQMTSIDLSQTKFTQSIR